MSQHMTLGTFDFTGFRAPAEPAPKSAMTPVNLGAVVAPPVSNAISAPQSFETFRSGPFMPLIARPVASVTMPPPVSAQSSPTPQVTAPATPPPTSVLVTSGGGTASPAPATIPPPYTDSNGNVWTYNPASGWTMNAAASAITPSPQTSTVVQATPSLTDEVATWLGGSTPLGSWNIPNALLTAGVVLAAAMMMSGSGTRRKNAYGSRVMKIGKDKWNEEFQMGRRDALSGASVKRLPTRAYAVGWFKGMKKAAKS